MRSSVGNISRIGCLILTGGLLLWLSANAAFAQQNLILNGSFEVGGQGGVQNFPNWDWLGPADNNSDYGVAESSTSPDVAELGDFYAYFHGNPTDGSQDCLGQTVNLRVGAEYTISYDLATDGSTLGSGAAMWVVIGTSFGIDLSQDVMLTAFKPNSSNALPYQEFGTNYIAIHPSEILSFHGIDATSSILLDNVTMRLADPHLNLGLSQANTLVFTWTSWTNGYRLQANTMFGTTNWVTLTNTPMASNSTNQVVLPAPESTVFYRLALP